MLLRKGNAMNTKLVSKETGASTATISRVNRSLQGGNDGYSIVFDRMKDND